MKRLPLTCFLCAMVWMLGSVSAPAQDLFLKKDGSSDRDKNRSPEKKRAAFFR
ncbi:MAG: hypothetical protein LRY57_03970 [Alphaproteobacteria bacterium]|nr:hypothetical protein [Alphaproteobacteria bacterium]